MASHAVGHHVDAVAERNLVAQQALLDDDRVVLVVVAHDAAEAGILAVDRDMIQVDLAVGQAFAVQGMEPLGDQRAH